MPSLVAVVAFDVLALVLALLSFDISEESFVLDVGLLARLALVALVGGDSDDDGGRNVLVVDVAGGGEGVNGGLVGGG